MQKRLFLLSMSCVLSAFLFSGCIALFLGAGVAGGIAISQDTIRLQYNCNTQKAYKATHDSLDHMGIINSEDQKANKIEATVEDSHITARIIPVTHNSTRIEVKARKNLLPNLDLASKIINDINGRLHAGF